MSKVSKKFALNRKGFSLVELMIVVAIIGMLAAVGIPQYAKFQAKARQSEAKSNLAGIFNAMKSFQSEWNTYTNNLANAGFGVEGKNLRYITGFTSGVSCAHSSTAGYSGPPEGSATSSDTWSTGNSNTAAATWHNQISFSNYSSATTATCTQNVFNAMSAGDPRNNPNAVAIDATTADRWTIDNSKSLLNVSMGIN